MDITEKMANLLQWIYDDGHGGSYRSNIQELLVEYDAARRAPSADVCPSCGEEYSGDCGPCSVGKCQA